jgi:phosphate transport system protein
MASDAIHSATRALLEADLKIAEEVISYDEKIDLYQHDLDTRIIDIIARQQPVASDLRALVTALRMSADLERMGDLAHHIAKVARLRHPEKVVPAELHDLVNHIGSVAENISRKIPTVIETRDIEMALQLEKDDDEMDKLHRQLIGSLTDNTWKHGVESAVDITLLGRYYERFADHAVSVSRRVYFLVTGTFANPTR